MAFLWLFGHGRTILQYSIGEVGTYGSSVLAVLGLSLHEEHVYRYLLSTMPATLEQVRHGLGMQQARTRLALARLEKSGFVSRLSGEPPRFAAVSPGRVDAALADKLAEIRQAQDAIAEIAGQYHAKQHAMEEAGAFEVIRGTAAMRERTLAMLSSARFEALNMVKPPAIAVHSAERKRPERDAVRGRLIFDSASMGDPGTLEAIRQTMHSRDEIRVHTKVPVKMLAVDRKSALIPLIRTGAEPAGVLIGESAVLDSILALFDYVWATAVRLHVDGVESPSPGGKPVLPEQDRLLLSLLLAGLTDEAIAAHLSVSVRTVERKARALMDAAHVRTRMQLGWEAARQRWL